MTLPELALLLEELGIHLDNATLGGKNKNRVMIPCPYAEWTHERSVDRKPSMAVWLEDETSCKFKCWTCHESGSLWELFQDIGQLSRNPVVQALALEVQRLDSPTISKILGACSKRVDGWGVASNRQKPSPTLPQALLNHFPKVIPTCAGFQYLRQPDRQIPFNIVERYDLRLHADAGRLLFPVFTRASEFQGFVGRIFGEREGVKYYNYFNVETATVLGGLQHVTKGVTKVLVTEGYFDVLGLARWLPSHIVPLCTFTANLADVQARVLLGLDVAIEIWYDGDTAGRRGSNQAVELLQKMGGTSKQVNLPDGYDPHQLTESQTHYFLNLGT